MFSQAPLEDAGDPRITKPGGFNPGAWGPCSRPGGGVCKRSGLGNARRRKLWGAGRCARSTSPMVGEFPESSVPGFIADVAPTGGRSGMIMTAIVPLRSAGSVRSAGAAQAPLGQVVLEPRSAGRHHDETVLGPDGGQHGQVAFDLAPAPASGAHS